MARLKAIRSPPGDQAASPSDQQSPRQWVIWRKSPPYVARIERFIATRCGWVEFAPLEEKFRAVRRPGSVVVRPVCGRLRHTAQASAVGLDDPDVVLADRAGAHECDQAIARLYVRRTHGAPASVYEVVAEATVLVAGLLRLHVGLSPVGTSQDAELARFLAAGARPADVGQLGDGGLACARRPGGQRILPAAPPARHLTTPRTSLEWLYRLNGTLDGP